MNIFDRIFRLIFRDHEYGGVRRGKYQLSVDEAPSDNPWDYWHPGFRGFHVQVAFEDGSSKGFVFMGDAMESGLAYVADRFENVVGIWITDATEEFVDNGWMPKEALDVPIRVASWPDGQPFRTAIETWWRNRRG